MKKGRLIVIDGADGSGKTTQAELLIDYLKSKNIPVEYYDFPQYYDSFHGKIVARLLRGEFGKLDQISPYLASLAYALDRASVKDEMQAFLNSGGYIIANRYATSNMAHQAAKFKDESKRQEYLDWEYELEYEVHKIPKEDLVIYLHVPWEFSRKLMEKKSQTHREWLKGKMKDIAEKNDQHQKDSIEMYLKLAKKYPHWTIINCIENNQLLSKEEIHEKIVRIINSLR